MQQTQNTNPQVLEEGLWSKTKYMVAKLGRLEKGGKIMGRGKQASLAAAQVEDTLQKESAKMLKGLVAVVQQHYPEFPNMEDHGQFLEACELYTSFYDSMAAGPTHAPDAEVFIPAVVANAGIVDLRVVWKHFLDYKLASVYNTMNENLEENNTVNASLGQANASDKKNVISGFNHDSTTMATLKSNKLPILLATLGSSLGAFGWILKTPFMQDWLNSLFDHTKDIVSYVNGNQVLGMVGNGEGITQTLGRLYPGVDLGPNASVENFHNVLKQIGGGNEDSGLKAISGMLKNPNKIGELKQMLASGKFHSMKELFNQHAGDPTSGKGGSWYETIKDGKLSVNIKQQIIKTVAVQGVKAGAIGAGIGSFLAPLGIALVAAGVTTKLLRMKGQKSSRAQIMNDLLLSWELLPMEDQGSQVMKQLGAAKDVPAALPAKANGQTGMAVAGQQGLATQGKEQGVSVQGQPQDPQRNALPPRTRRFNSNASDIEDAQIIDDEPTGIEQGQKAVAGGQPAVGAGESPAVAGGDEDEAGTGADRGPDGAQGVGAPKAATSGMVGRLDPKVNKDAAANLKAFGDTITSADKRDPQEIADEIEYLKLAVKEIPAKSIMPKVKAIQGLLQSKDIASQLKAVKGFRAMSAYIKNLYVGALVNYSKDTSNALRSDMTYSGADGAVKKKAGTNLSEAAASKSGYQTSLFAAAPGKEDLLMGTLGQICVKLAKKLEGGTLLSPEEVKYLSQKLSSNGAVSARDKAMGKTSEPGLVQKIVKAINTWLKIRMSDYKAYLKHLKTQGAEQPAAQGQAPAQDQEEVGTSAEVMNEGLNPFLIKESVDVLNPFFMGK